MKQAAEYVRKRNIQNLSIYAFDPFDGPGTEYYGLPRNLGIAEIREKLLFNRPSAGTYIISTHYIIRMRHVSPAWKTYKPIDRIGESLWVYAF